MIITDSQERILEKATELFMRFGVRSVTMSDIAKELGMSKKTIYQYYSDKNALVRAFAKNTLESNTCIVDNIIDEAQDGLSMLFRLSEHFKQMLKNMNPILFNDLHKYYPEVWKLYEEHKVEQMQDNLVKAMERGQEQGLFLKYIDKNILARMRTAQVEMGFNPSIFPQDKFSTLDVQMELAEHFIRGICTEKGIKLMEKYKAELNNQ
ncbi:TetR/AcrR family transcriptional regulator [Limibacter armeniacum]|uniref:TetR/AcrR family transcriptional regulator n=1 Tax=Limibacter armeniacum TaxID=466084 RepID=UPI002FE6C047